VKVGCRRKAAPEKEAEEKTTAAPESTCTAANPELDSSFWFSVNDLADFADSHSIPPIIKISQHPVDNSPKQE
jgi:hypothetical protein